MDKWSAFAMKRRIFKLGLFLLLGAIINVAVAWALARWWPASGSDQTRLALGSSSSQDPCWVFGMYGETGTLMLLGHPREVHMRRTDEPLDNDQSRLLPIWSELRSPPSTNDFLNYRCWEYARGWPMLALRLVGYSWAGRSAPVVVKGGIELATPSSRVYLPYHPIWPGFAINTIFYAALLWMLFAVPFALRRRRRIKRGLCPACAYPVGTNPHCTECGKPVPIGTD